MGSIASKLMEAVLLAPGEESGDRPGVGQPGVGVADVGGEELEEAPRGPVPTTGHELGHHQGHGLGPGRGLASSGHQIAPHRPILRPATGPIKLLAGQGILGVIGSFIYVS